MWKGNNMTLDVIWNNGAYIFVSIIAMIGFAAVGVFLYFRFQRERINYKNELENFLEGVQTKSEITSSINSYINRITKDMTFSLIYIDLDHYTDLVNAFGTTETKRMIETIARNINKILPIQVQIGRVNEDQFLIFLRNDYNRNEAIKLANTIKDTIAQPITMYSDTVINPSASLAIAFYPMDGDSSKKLLDSLKIAIYVAKRDGGNKVVIASTELSQKENENVNYYTQVKQAMANNEFTLYYQPIIDIKNKTVFGTEALLRWNHPEFGILSPYKFINILEQSGDINWIGVWGMESLIKQYFELKRQFAFKEFELSMNLSTRQLLNEKLPVEYQRILKKYHMQASSITLEVEEFIIFEKHEIIKQNILKLKELGFKIAIDSFAIDQTVLNVLKDLPIDFIKLASEFLKDEEDVIKERYIELIIAFAKERGIRVIAEGIEDAAMYKQLKKYDISLAEGYYFERPISAEDLNTFIIDEVGLKNKLEENE